MAPDRHRKNSRLNSESSSNAFQVAGREPLNMEFHFQAVILLLLVAGVVAMLTRRLRLPNSVGLVGAGIALAFVQLPYKFVLSNDLIFTALLPPLLFEAAFHLDWQQLRPNSPVIATLVTLGLLISASVTATGMHFLVH
jgi:Na+:H+ antiporter